MLKGVNKNIKRQRSVEGHFLKLLNLYTRIWSYLTEFQIESVIEIAYIVLTIPIMNFKFFSIRIITDSWLEYLISPNWNTAFLFHVIGALPNNTKFVFYIKLLIVCSQLMINYTYYIIPLFCFFRFTRFISFTSV